jgi:hypothetical protein
MSAPVLVFSQPGQPTAPRVKRAGDKIRELYALDRVSFEIVDELLSDLIRRWREHATIGDDEQDGAQ